MSQYPPPPPYAAPVAKASWWKRPVALWLAIVIGFTSLLVGIGLGAGTKETAKTTAAVATTTTQPAPTAPTEPTTTTAPSTTTEAQPVQVLDLSGKNKTSSDNFSVTGRWTIHVDTSGGAGTAVKILRSDGQTVDYISFDAPGDSAQRGSGTFFLEVSPFGATYHVTVIDDPG